MTTKIKLVTASAGSGKTHKLQETLAELVNPSNPNRIRPEAVIATTFTKKSALELKERARKALINKGYFDEAVKLEGALISTVHSVCTKIIEMFCYEAGLPPEVEVLPAEDATMYFNLSLSETLTTELIDQMQDLTSRIIYVKPGESFDWRQVVSEMISQARSNGMGPKELEESYRYSWEKLQELLPRVMDNPQEFEHKILKDGKAIHQKLAVLPHRTKKDDDFFKNLTSFIYYLENGWSIKWDSWQGLTGELDKTGRDLATSFQGLVSNYLAHPKFQSDYRNYLRHIFLIAGKSIENYQKFKKERGLLDFVDMECIVADLLDNKIVQKRMSENFDLLMVDEFQDTSPIQLDIFLKLSKIIKNVIWVGDQKQSIYGFRGADPALIESLLEKMKPKLEIETLSQSFRSRSDLVQHANALFSKAFEDQLPKEHIVLSPTRTDLNQHDAPIELWRIQKKDKTHAQKRSWRGIAKKIQSLVDKELIVAKKNDKNQDESQVLTYKDIAVLIRSNESCSEMAEYLSELGIPVSLEQKGFLKLPESSLMMAALRYYAFPHDSLAALELKLLIEGKDNVEQLIQERVDYVGTVQLETENIKSKYGFDFWAIQRIDQLRTLAHQLSPVEIINSLIIQLELQRVVCSWEGVSNRESNLALFRHQAQKFEDYCRRMNLGATLGGFLNWINELDEKKLLGFGANEENAVTVMTWHKSKGLEWPVVILLDTHKEVKKLPFGIKVFSKDESINLEKPLQGRLIRYWFNFLQPSRTKTQFLQIVTASSIAKEHEHQMLQEAKRLLYVGFTRARDYLFIPLESQATPELIGECLGESDLELPLDEGKCSLPWAPNCSEISVVHFDEENPPNDSTLLVAKKVVLKEFRNSSQEKSFFENYLINPSHVGPLLNGTATLFGSYGKRLTAKVKVDDDLIGDCLHDIAALSSLDKDGVERVLRNYQFENVLISDEIIQQLESYHNFLGKNGIVVTHREWPIMAREEGKFLNGVIDQLASEGSELCIIDHKSYQGTQLAEKSLSYSGQLHVYQKAMELAGTRVKRKLIHFITLGSIYEIKP